MSIEPHDDADTRRYGRSFADVYDEWYHGVPTDDLVAFVGALDPRPRRVLELGVGTGRVALPLADAGYDVVGLDASAAMLERLRAKPGADRIDLVEGDAADPDVYPAEPVDLVLGAFNLIFNLTSVDAQQRCLAAAAACLTADGSVLVEAFVPRPITERSTDLVTRSVEADRVILIATETDAADQTVRGNHIEITEAGTRLRPWTIRVTPPAELDALAERSGLRLAGRWADFAGAPFVDGESTHHVSRYRRI